jgi:hypothetical protein
MTITIIEAIQKINPTAEVSVSGEDINTLVWENGTTPISNADILAKQVELQTAYDALEYSRDRAVSYPTWQDQMDMQYKDLLNGTTNWKDSITQIKTDNPKN